MENNFELFDEALHEFNKNNEGENQDEIEKNDCSHTNIIDDNGIKLCEDCGLEITRDIQYNKEWRYYGASDTRHNSDPNRCHVRKTEEKTIYKDVENMGFGDKIISLANKIYEEVTGGKIYRGNSRKSIVFACIFHAYKIHGNPQSCENLIEIFRLERKVGLKGLKHVNLNASKDSQIRTTYITPENLVQEIMKKFDATESQIDEVVKIYHQVKNKSSILNRSRPQSVASGLVRYYILLKDKDISMQCFRQKVKLSELTINRIAKEISKILGTPEIV